jgi:hypothetical protein
VEAPNDTLNNDSIRVHPSLLLAMLRHGEVATGRLWLILRHLDANGRGCLALADLRQALTTPRSPYYLCTWRHLRGLLARGQGRYWQSDDRGRLWLRGVGGLAAALGVERLSGRPVALPLALLLGPIGPLRANFYSTFHAGRRRPAPIGRPTLTRLTGVPGRTQRYYDQVAGVRARLNLAIGQPFNPVAAHEQGWARGRALFCLADRQGRHGPPGARYIAWRLPNTYSSAHRPVAAGRQKKINHQIGLVSQRARGNNRPLPSSPPIRCQRLFFSDGAAAGRAYNRDASHDRYWPPATGQAAHFVTWRVLPAQPDSG